MISYTMQTLPQQMPIPPAMKSSKNLIGLLLFNFCKKTTVHGINRLSQVKNQRSRIFWILIVSAAAMGFTINLFKIVEKYLQYQVLSNTYHDHELFQFPDMSICNLNPIFVPPADTVHYKSLMHWIKEFKQLGKSPKLASHFLRNLADYLYIQREPYSHPGWSLIVSCRYQSMACSNKHFDKITLWPYGSCYTFNPFRLNMSRLVMKQVIYKGYRPNLELIIYKAIDFPAEMKTDPHGLITMPSGVLFMMHEPLSHPYIFEGYLLDFFSVVDIGIIKKFHEPRLKPCIKIRTNFTYTDPVTNASRRYLGRWADCLYDIIQREVVKSCRCYMEYYPISDDLKHFQFCKSPSLNKTSMSLILCLQEAYSKILMNEDNMNHCYQDLCEHSSITTVISQAKYPAVEERNSAMVWLRELAEMERNELKHFGSSDLAIKALHQHVENFTLLQAFINKRKDLLNNDFVDRNFMLLRVVAQSLFMDKVEETEEYPVSRLLSDIGGCVGLWLGASLITLFELFDLLLDSADIFCNNPYYRYKRLRREMLEIANNDLRGLNRNNMQQFDKWRDECKQEYSTNALSQNTSDHCTEDSLPFGGNNIHRSRDYSLISSV